MKQYRTRSGLTQVMPSFDEVQAMDHAMEGWCLACGSTQTAEPDVRRDPCESCGAAKVYGAQELALMGLCHG